ncbi:hypothetical protein FA15DRAFT_394006 [Coprinopsis marcescibilis]|uniref:BOD1/SHG1 domain-containing protein n=1 Tax=Coprinopsis marcescibilis TaxID=230819 RepID=A0A5C3L909_COPMA|nr:hypothetical protein FA15DRAFT_394006 [Coprinopsis marcescibilis]
MSLSPESLVDDFKKSGGQERLQKEIEKQFQSDEFIGTLQKQIEGIIRGRMQSEEMMTYLPPDISFGVLQQEINKDGVVDRFINEEFMTKIFQEKSFQDNLTASLEKLIKPNLETFLASSEGRSNSNVPEEGQIMPSTSESKESPTPAVPAPRDGKGAGDDNDKMDIQ